MKNFYSTLIGVAFPSLLLAQMPTVTNLNFAIQHADVSVIDIDGDGHKDILISGENTSGKTSKAFKNNGNGTFTEFLPAFPFTPVTRTTIDWNDINQDGKPDIIISGSIDDNGTTDKSIQLFTSNGSGIFTPRPVAGLTAVAPSCGFADLNNDGYTDFFVFGNRWQGKSAIYINDKVGGFTKTEFADYDLVDPDVTLVDFDNDGDLDLFLMGHDDASSVDISLILRNNNGSFTPLNMGITAKTHGSSAWGDVNGDGYLDLLINGWGAWDGSETTGDVARLYINNAGNGTFTKVATFQQYSQGSTGDGVRLADWDNDGRLDVFVTGWSGNLGRQATSIYLNNGDLTFTAFANNDNIPGVGESSIEIADLNNDGKLDLVVTGTSFNNYGPGDLGGMASAVVINNTANTNTAPTAPTNLNATGNQTELSLSWDAATDNSTPANSLSYNLFVKDDNGKYFYAPLADETTGNLLVQRLGNVQLNKIWKIKDLPAGNYEWGVQAIDHSFAASVFAKGTFTINPDGTLPVTLQHFKASKESNGVKLNWVTLSELNNSHFDVEKSADGKNFSLLKHEAAKTGLQALSYTVYDRMPFNGANYYRLTQFDNDGKSTTLGLEVVDFKLDASIKATVYPNPVVNDINILLNNTVKGNATVAITDLNGKTVYSQQHIINNNAVKISHHLPTGLYLLNLQTNSLNQSVKIIVK